MDGINKKQQKPSLNKRYQLGSTAMTIGRKAAMAGVSGGVGRAAEKAVEAAAHGAMATGANKLARRKRLQMAKARRATKLSERTKKPKKKLTGVGFGIMLSLTIIKDILDVVFTLTFFLSILTMFLGLFVTFTVMFYLVINRVNLDLRKLVTMIGSTVIELMPLLGVLPMATFNLLMIRYLTNSKRGKKVALKLTGSFA